MPILGNRLTNENDSPDSDSPGGSRSIESDSTAADEYGFCGRRCRQQKDVEGRHRRRARSSHGPPPRAALREQQSTCHEWLEATNATHASLNLGELRRPRHAMPIADKLQRASEVPGVEGVEVIFPDEVREAAQIADDLAHLRLEVAAVNVNLKGIERSNTGRCRHQMRACGDGPSISCGKPSASRAISGRCALRVRRWPTGTTPSFRSTTGARGAGWSSRSPVPPPISRRSCCTWSTSRQTRGDRHACSIRQRRSFDCATTSASGRCALQVGSVATLTAGGPDWVEVGRPPTDHNRDWVLLVRPAGTSGRTDSR